MGVSEDDDRPQKKKDCNRKATRSKRTEEESMMVTDGDEWQLNKLQGPQTGLEVAIAEVT